MSQTKAQLIEGLNVNTSAPADSLVIDSSGNVGLGNNSPSTILDVNGDVTITDKIIHSGDTNTAIRFPAADTFAVETAGTERLRVDSSGNVGIGTTSPFSDAQLTVDNGGSGDAAIAFSRSAAGQNDVALVNTSGEFIVKNGVASTVSGLDERLRIDSSGRLLVGTSSARTWSGTTSQIQLEGTSFSSASISTTANTNSSAGAYLALNKSRGTSIGSNTVVQSGDQVGIIYFNAADGSKLVPAAQINCKIDGTPGSDDMPGRLEFSTSNDGASSPTEKMRIDRAGNIFSARTYDSTTANGANINVASDGRFRRSTSSVKYKIDVETLEDQYADALLNCRPVWYRSACETDNPNFGWWGFIAEEVAEIDPRLVYWKTVEITYDENGSVVETPCDPEPEGVQYDRFVPHLLNLIKRQKEQIEAMEARLSALEA